MSTLPRNHLGSDQLYPDEYGYPNNGGGGYFNPLEAMTSSPLRSRYVLCTIEKLITWHKTNIDFLVNVYLYNKSPCITYLFYKI